MKVIDFPAGADPAAALTTEQKARLFDLICERAIEVKLPIDNGTIAAVERRQSRAGIAEPLVRVLEAVSK